MKKDYNYIKNHIVFTRHGKNNIHHRRKYIPVSHVIQCISSGQLGFAGSRRYKVTDYNLNLEVIYKIDNTDPNEPLYIIITYYKINKSKYKNYQITS